MTSSVPPPGSLGSAYATALRQQDRSLNTFMNAPARQLIVAKNTAKMYFNGVMPEDKVMVDGPNEIFTSPSTGKFYAKVGLLWKSWTQFPTLEAAQKAKGVKGGARRKTRGHKNKRKSRRSRS